ncbi:DEAD/DEAH box helicase [Paenibacillus sp. ACRRX]|uniref:DEAD/DEAH box helicase n=1 Tax=unclassified Paenibacillus TaxID=185978 RepID=UPI001EF54A24|nr:MULTISPECIES: DEAD/DEAH box helicase [unclassified Paenibacillus]MCG7408257.1 DEAD/DEAH box helicase [Paenibacillus sp. ACRRX]MDK8181358.1 DEAD/DEAH box helicase [Paenibacillus sp. UMB4589-SE434]
MSLKLTLPIIKSQCGLFSYERGEAYYTAGRVTLIHHNFRAGSFEATVHGTQDHYRVNVDRDPNKHITAVCTCPGFPAKGSFCKHIAAVLLCIHELEQDERSPAHASPIELADHTDARPEQAIPQGNERAAELSAIASSDIQVTKGMLGLFSGKQKRSAGARSRFDERVQLEMEFTCKPISYGYRKFILAIECKVGPKRLYVVQKLREFLDSIDRGRDYTFSKLFTYDPLLHSFHPQDDAILQQLIRAYRQEEVHLETAHSYSSPVNRAGGERTLPLPAYIWHDLSSLLAQAKSVTLDHEGICYPGLQIVDEPLPLKFKLDQAEDEGFQMEVLGMNQITVMEQYGMVISGGRLIKLSPDHCKRLSEMKQLLESYRKQVFRIPSGQIEPYMDQVIPGLSKLGSVSITQAIAERIVQPALQAKLYLDRVRDRLLAGLEFQYGDIVLNPLEAHTHQRAANRILIRDTEQEQQIMEMMEQCPFAKTEGGYFLDDEDAEYDFLYHVVPKLKAWVQIYATSAVKARLHAAPVAPQITVNVDERTDWLEFKFEMDGIAETDIRHLLQSLEDKRKYYRLPSGALLSLESEAFQEIGRFMDTMDLYKEEEKAAFFRIPIARSLQLMHTGDHGNAISIGRSLRLFLENMRNPDNLDFPLPDHLTPVLRDYQKYGYQWMRTLAHYHFGGILADDMGLGKTLQTITFLVSMLPDIRKQKMPALVIAPASLLYNWRNELQRFAPELKVAIADGSKAERIHLLSKEFAADVIITSYPLLRRDIKLYAKPAFHTLILDEAQAFKNYTTQTAHAVKTIQAKYRFALTGTPVENRLEELWSIFDVVFPELFSDRQAFNDLPRDIVAKRARPFLLRRLKTDVLKELPEKIESVQASELLPEQKKLYLAYLAKLQKDTLKHLDETGFQKSRIKILAGLTRLRQLCCHPALFVDGYAGSSAKFELLLDIIEESRSAGRRLLVFSQFTGMLNLIKRELTELGVAHFYLDGSTPSAERVELCSRFNEGERDLFLISLKAGGTGLNLTGADTVILYDLWWNPAVEQQAADRAYRIGQKNVVQVIRLVTQGTVEDKMYELQQRKKDLIEEVIQPGEEALSSLTEQEIRDILML